MTSTQEPNTMAPQSALCIYSRKRKAKQVVSVYFGTKMFQFCFRIISFLSLESELSIDSKDSERNFDRVCSTTVNFLLRALRAICNISCNNGEDLFADELLVLYIRNGKLDTKCCGGAGKRKAKKKLTQGLLWMVNSSPKRKVRMCVYSLFTVVNVIFLQCLQ